MKIRGVLSLAAIGMMALGASGQSFPVSDEQRAGIDQPTQTSRIVYSNENYYGPFPQLNVREAAEAAEREARAEMTYEVINRNITVKVARLSDEFRTSPEYMTATAELREAEQAYEDSREAALQSLNDERYHALLAQRAALDEMLDAPELSQGRRIAIAEEKLRYNDQITRMREDAVRASDAVQDAIVRMARAQAELTVMERQFRRAVPRDGEVAFNVQQLAAARIERAAARAYLRTYQQAYNRAVVEGNFFEDGRKTQPAFVPYGPYFYNGNLPYRYDAR